MTRSIPRLLGFTTVAAGVTAAGYVGLVTGACKVEESLLLMLDAERMLTLGLD